MNMRFFIATGLIVLSACKSDSSSQYVEQILPVNEVYNGVSWERGEVEEFYVFGEKKDTTSVLFQYSFIKDDSPLKKMTDSLTVSFLTEYKKPMQVNRNFFKNEAAAFLKDFKDYVSEDFSNLFPWYLIAEVDYCEIDSIYVKGEFMMESYTGGAHGSHFVAYRMINTKSNKIVQLADLFSNRMELDKRVEQQFRKEYAIDANANLKEEGFWFEDGKFTVNENFYFDQHDIVFYFNPYEIGPYAMGAFTVHVPLTSLKDLAILK